MRSDELSDKLYNWFRPSGCQPPRVYSLPKIHKDRVRSDLLFCVSTLPPKCFPNYCPASISHGSFHKIICQKFQAIIETMAKERQSPDELILSFDVPSLFTNVPIQAAVDVIRSQLQDGNTLHERTALQPNSTAALLMLCLRSTYFCFGGEIYKQREGLQWVILYQLWWLTSTWSTLSTSH